MTQPQTTKAALLKHVFWHSVFHPFTACWHKLSTEEIVHGPHASAKTARGYIWIDQCCSCGKTKRVEYRG